jgi:alpha/beta superfamily hydrolase
MRRLILPLLLLVLAGCGAAPAPAAGLPEGPVTFTTDDGVKLSGTIFGQGPTAVVLAHMRPTDQTSWQPFAKELGAAGFTTLTFDFRGYGDSEGRRDGALIDHDVQAAIRFLRERGFQRIVCVGASMGGTACAESVREPGLAGLVVIASPQTFGGKLNVEQRDFEGIAYPKLFISAEGDDLRASLVQMYEWAPDPKQLTLIPGYAHGTDMFGGPQADQFREVMITFLKGL